MPNHGSTHSDLVQAGAGWLQWNKDGCRCPFVVADIKLADTEVPDVFGLSGLYYSYLIECKVSWKDFLADQDKPFRRKPDAGVGNYRFYLCPDGVITVDDLPPKWGLLCYSTQHKITVLRKPLLFNAVSVRASERELLYQLVMWWDECVSSSRERELQSRVLEQAKHIIKLEKSLCVTGLEKSRDRTGDPERKQQLEEQIENLKRSLRR